jgi:hypothetical protein
MFNYRGVPTQAINLDMGGGDTTAQMLAIPEKVVPRSRRAVAEWPNGKWLTGVANPNTPTCFGQWFPTSAGGTGINKNCAGPNVFLLGKGLAINTPIEWEATLNFAVYGTISYATDQRQGSVVSVGGEGTNGVVANGLNHTLSPLMMTEKPSSAGVRAFARAEQAQSGFSTKEIVSGIKAGKDIIEGVTGSSIGETLAELAGSLFGALL